MKRASLAVLLAVAVLAAAGCAGSAKQANDNTGPPARTGVRMPEKYPGLEMSRVPAGYRPPISAHSLLHQFTRLRGTAGGRPEAHLWTINGTYPAWVFTAHYPGGTAFGVYDLRGRRWTMSFRTPLHFAASACRGGTCGFPANQGALDFAAGYAERTAGAIHVFAGDSIDDAADRVDLYLVHAPRSLIHALNVAHPGTYVIHNDAPRTFAAVMRVENGLDFTALQAKGIDIASAGPNGKGQLIVGVTKNIPTAQAYFDATYGRGFARVVHDEPAHATPAIGLVR